MSNINEFIIIHISDAVNNIATTTLAENEYDEKKAIQVIKDMPASRVIDKVFYAISGYFDRNVWSDVSEALTDRFIYATYKEEAEENMRQLKLMIMNTITIVSLFQI